VPFHAEIRRSLRSARVFNLGEAELRPLLESWLRGGVVELGGQRWEVRDSALSVLEGPMLEPADLAHGQGWHHATRSGRDVTRTVLEEAARASATAPGAAPVVAVLAETARARPLAAAALAELGVTAVPWSAARERLLRGVGPHDDLAAALLVVDPRAEPAWLLEAGLAVGALGPRVVIARLAAPDADPAAPELHVIDVGTDAGDPDAAAPLARRLREALAEPPR
jgi:hypothetical protein